MQEDVNKQILTALLGNMDGTEYQSWLTHLKGGLLDERKIQVEIPEESSSSASSRFAYLASSHMKVSCFSRIYRPERGKVK